MSDTISAYRSAFKIHWKEEQNPIEVDKRVQVEVDWVFTKILRCVPVVVKQEKLARKRVQAELVSDNPRQPVKGKV